MIDLNKFPKAQYNSVALIREALDFLSSKLSDEEMASMHEVLHAIRARAIEETANHIIIKAANIKDDVNHLTE